MIRPYVFTKAAEADLRDVIRYTRQQWGDAQVRRYVSRLQNCAEALATGDGRHREMGDLYPGLRMMRCEHHYVFCLPRPEGPALIVAILHERMDLIARVGGRLG